MRWPSSKGRRDQVQSRLLLIFSQVRTDLSGSLTPVLRPEQRLQREQTELRNPVPDRLVAAAPVGGRPISGPEMRGIGGRDIGTAACRIHVPEPPGTAEIQAEFMIVVGVGDWARQS